MSLMAPRAVVIGLVWLIAGCAGGVALSDQTRSSLRRVSIDPNVAKPTTISYRGQRQALETTVMGPAIGTLAAGFSGRRPAAELVAVMEHANIDLGRLVVEQFEAELKASGSFHEVASEDAEAQFVLAIRLFGFGQAMMSFGGLRPILAVAGTLVARDGSVLWEHSVIVTNIDSRTPSRTHEQYVANPVLIREAFTAAARYAAAELVRHVRGPR